MGLNKIRLCLPSSNICKIETILPKEIRWTFDKGHNKVRGQGALDQCFSDLSVQKNRPRPYDQNARSVPK